MKTSEQYIQKLVDEFELPVEKVALVWSVAELCWSDYGHETTNTVRMYTSVKSLLEELFPE